MLVDACRHRENIRIEDDVFRREPHLFRQYAISARANRDLALARVGLALLVEGHDDHRRAVAHHRARMIDERRLAFLQRDRIDDRLSLHAFQPCLDHLEFRGIDHHRHARDIGLGRDEVQEFLHCLGGIE